MNSFSAWLRGGGFDQKFSKNSNAQGGMLKLRFDWYISLKYSLFSLLVGFSVNQEMYMKRIFLKSPLVNYFNFFPKMFLPKFEVPSLGCGLSASAAYPLLCTVSEMSVP